MSLSHITPDEAALDRAMGATLRAYRTALGLSQQAVANQIDLTFQQVQKYETGTNRVSFSRLVKLAAVLGTNAETLVAKAQGLNSALIANDDVDATPPSRQETKLLAALKQLPPRVARAITTLTMALAENDGDVAVTAIGHSLCLTDVAERTAAE